MPVVNPEKMARGKTLTEREKGAITALHGQGLSQMTIEEQVNRSTAVIQNFLYDPDAYGKEKRGGRRCKLSKAERRNLLREVSKGQMSARELQKALNLPINIRRVQQLPLHAPNLVYRKTAVAPKLSVDHKMKRVDWAIEHVT